MSNAIVLLKKDHVLVRKLLKTLEGTTERSGARRKKLLARIGSELRAHGAIEEEIFYPALRKAAEQDGNKEVKVMVAEAFEEHRAAVQLVLTDLEQTSASSIQFSGRAKVLKELVEHHAHEEEQEMFKKARGLLETSQLADLGEEMESRKQVLLARSGKRGGRRSRRS